MARPLRIEIENGIYHHFGDDSRPLQRRVHFPQVLNRVEAPVFCGFLIPTSRTAIPATQLAERYGRVSSAAISQAVQRAEARCDENALPPPSQTIGKESDDSTNKLIRPRARH